MTATEYEDEHAAPDTAHAPHSVADWETLFEDPETGVIAVIRQAHSLEALVLSARTLAHKLLVHDGEEDRLAAYELRLEVIAAENTDSEDLEPARKAIIKLLRELEAEGKQAAVSAERPAKDGKSHRASAKSKAAAKGKWSSERINLIGIIGGVVGLLLMVAAVAFYLYHPEMPAKERGAVAAIMLRHAQTARPDESWEIVQAEFIAPDRFDLVIVIKNSQHVTKFGQLTAMERAKMAVDLCPAGPGLKQQMAKYGVEVWVEVRSIRKVLTGTFCPQAS